MHSQFVQLPLVISCFNHTCYIFFIHTPSFAQDKGVGRIPKRSLGQLLVPCLRRADGLLPVLPAYPLEAGEAAGDVGGGADV